jgi:hypothetical protein
MTVVAEALSRLTGAYPAILEPRQAALVEPDAPDGLLPRAEDAVVTAEQPDEDRGRHQQPPEADR